jgi:branched-chain amino acid transport system permease protein
MAFAPLALPAILLSILALVPFVGTDYHLALAISILSYLVLATAWAMFSGPTGYISLATVAFFGIGAYAVAVLGEKMPWPIVLLVAAGIGAAVALVVGLSTLRLSGIYFVIFSFGLAELIRQVVTWYEATITRSVGRYIFLDVSRTSIFWQLFALAVAVFVIGFVLRRSRIGLALRVIGEDEVVGRHCGINTPAVKVFAFVLSAVFMTVTGAIMAPRWTYIDPAIAFNATLSFQVVIMALLGGAGALYGPLLGVVPLILLFDFIGAYFPNYFSILLGLVFIIIVYAIPNGVAGLLPFKPAEINPETRPEKKADAVPLSSATTGPLLQIEGLSKSFGGLQAVDNLSFDLKPGTVTGLIGPNGSGKTTALNMISGLIAPSAGAISVDGQSTTGWSPERVARRGVARTFQIVRVLGDLTCAENVLAALYWRGQPVSGSARGEAAVLLARVGLAGKDATPANQLTYIDQKRLELARALALRPRLLLLDEWLAGLNPTELQEGIAVIASLRDEGYTILMVEHVMDAIRSLCDRCIVMSAGRKLTEGATQDVLAHPDVIRAYLGDGDA